jgi:mono/diheme cytochrome c family protein
MSAQASPLIRSLRTVFISKMPSPFQILLTSVSLVPLWFTIAAAEEAPLVVMAEKHRALFKEHCVSCHSAEKQKGKFRLDDLPFTITDIETAEKWQKVLNQMNSGEMPPEDEKQPANAAKADLLDDLSNVMVAARRTLSDQNGVITMRRLNRREYRNTLRELLGVEINVAELPADTGNAGFDTVGADLFMSGNQVEQYQALGRDALDEAFEWQAAAGVEQKLHYEAEDSLKVIQQKYAENLDALERAKKWAQAVEEAAAKSENAAVVATLRKESKTDDNFRRSWAKLHGAPAPEDFGFKTVENNADKANRALGYGMPMGAGYMRPYHEYYLKQPNLDKGAYLTIAGGLELPNDNLTLFLPFAWKSLVGDYVVRLRIAAVEKAPAERRFIEFGIDPRNGQVMSTHHITGTMEAPQIIEIPLTLTRQHAERANRTLFIREKGTLDHFTQTRAKFGAAKAKNGIGPELALWVDWMELVRLPNSRAGKARAIAALGIPLDDQATPPPAELRAALERFCTEAFRGSAPQVSFVDRLLALYELRSKAGDKHSAALKSVLSVVLAAPQFLYLAEPSSDEKRRPLTGEELATRLSYFLWGAPPDAELRGLAKSGELMKPEVLVAQTNRLLDDPRSKDFTRPFVHQWLVLDRLDFFEFNRTLFPRFDASTKLASRNEVYATFEHLLRHDAPLRDLLKSDYAVINSVMAHYYGIEGVTGDAFEKVSLPKDSPRGGLLGMAAVMAMGGNGERTSPVERGAWVLRKLLHDPPPPAPANVPQITRLAGKVLTTKERLQAHQEDAQCASCHRKIDPIGFGLENFDAAGGWRTQDTYQVMDNAGKPVPNAKKTWTIESTAQLHKGPAFKDYFELRDIIASKSDNFAKGFSEALIEYALGRPVGFRDEPLITEMLAAAKKEKIGARAFVRALVESKEFHTK